jgi:conjugal transfer pilus assembly protein TraU
MYPIRLAGYSITPSGPDPESKVDQPLCTCDDGGLQHVGLSIGFREPSRMLDVVKDSFCLASLGMDMGDSTPWGDGGAQSPPPLLAGQVPSYKAHTHYYYFNPLIILEILMDMSCLEKLPLDVAALSELDPFVQSDDLLLLAFPETVLFANPVAIIACAADAVAATVGNPLDALFWCAGAWGSTYPLSNSGPGNEDTWVQNAALVAAKYLARGHRELLNWGTKGEAAMCGPYPQPIWQKTQYKLQLVQPVKMRSCIPIGRPGLMWSSGKNPPVPGKNDNFSMIVWRYRDCCSF